MLAKTATRHRLLRRPHSPAPPTQPSAAHTAQRRRRGAVGVQAARTFALCSVGLAAAVRRTSARVRGGPKLADVEETSAPGDYSSRREGEGEGEGESIGRLGAHTHDGPSTPKEAGASRMLFCVGVGANSWIG